MEAVVVGLHTKYVTREVEVTVELLEQIGNITKLADRLTFVIKKPYDSITPALNYEVATFLYAQGYPVSVPDVVPEGVLPEQGEVPEVPPTIVTQQV